MAAQMLDMQTSLEANQEEMKQLQVQTLEQLAQLQKQVQALLTQTYELHEYPIPRLFVVLPEDTSRWDHLNPLTNKFRLYFLCECGEHTKSTNSKIPHHIHLAKHEGYDIARPTEFFQQFGPYVLTILRMLKFGISVAGVAVKWVCIDHYRENYQAKSAQSFRNLVASLSGSFNENTGQVEVRPYLREQAQVFYPALEKAKSVYELSIHFFRTPTYNDFKDLRDTLHKTNVGVLKLTGVKGSNSVGDILNRSRQLNPILDIMGYSSIKSISLHLIDAEFCIRTSLSSRKDDFSNLRYLVMDLRDVEAVGHHLKYIVSKAPNLDILILHIAMSALLDIFSAIVEHQTYPVFVKDQQENQFINFLPPTGGAQQPKRTLQSIEQIFRDHGGQIAEWSVGNRRNFLSTEMEAFAAATQDGSRLKALVVTRDLWLTDRSIDSLVSIIERSKLQILEIALLDEEDRIRILDSIPWNHLRTLDIQLGETQQLIIVMEALLEGIVRAKVSGKLELKGFKLGCTDKKGVQEDEQDWLQLFLSETMLVHLDLWISLDRDQIIALVGSIDASRLQSLELRADRFNEDDVEAILESVEHATDLQKLKLYHAEIAKEQKERMRRKGIILTG
ncbi:hypothetical protein B0O80DRAFT_475482 [Mortierella sp. GBAus27b]|nr:hypothetical protein B0O80DRAFT_475482 [Mortierella sp. GBAus27b]